MTLKSCNRDQYSSSSVVLPGIRRVQIDEQTVDTPVIANVAVASANTEVSYSLPSGTVKFEFKCRDTARLQLAYNSGESGTTYRTISPGAVYSESGLDSSASFTLYFQSTKAGVTVEVVSWS